MLEFYGTHTYIVEVTLFSLGNLDTLSFFMECKSYGPLKLRWKPAYIEILIITTDNSELLYKCYVFHSCTLSPDTCPYVLEKNSFSLSVGRLRSIRS